MSVEKVKQFFEHVVVKYNCGDVRALLDAELEAAGPLLSCVMNGIDLVGGMMLGFCTGSRQRSVKFMAKYLKLHTELAKLVYALVRCGVAHEGTTKLAINYFVYPSRLDRGTFLYKDVDNAVWLNVVELAFLYLEAIDEIAKDVGAHLGHIPDVNSRDEAIFTDALEHINADMDGFCLLTMEFLEALKKAEIKYMSSASPFLAEWLTHFTVVKK